MAACLQVMSHVTFSIMLFQYLCVSLCPEFPVTRAQAVNGATLVTPVGLAVSEDPDSKQVLF